MGLYRILRTEVRKNILVWQNPWACLLVTLMGFTTSVYTDSSNGRTYSALEAMISFDREYMETHFEFAWLQVVGNVFSGYLPMFLPMICSFSVMMLFGAERNSGYIRYQIHRTNQLQYCFSKVFSIMVTSGCITMLGVALFAIAALFFFPQGRLEMIPEGLRPVMEDIIIGAIAPKMLQLLWKAFFFGVISVTLALLVSSICKNTYVVICAPFVITYMSDIFIQNRITEAFQKMDTEKQAFWNIFRPSGLAYVNILDGIQAEEGRIIIFQTIVVISTFILFYRIMKCRFDKGC